MVERPILGWIRSTSRMRAPVAMVMKLAVQKQLIPTTAMVTLACRNGCVLGLEMLCGIHI